MRMSGGWARGLRTSRTDAVRHGGARRVEGRQARRQQPQQDESYVPSDSSAARRWKSRPSPTLRDYKILPARLARSTSHLARPVSLSPCPSFLLSVSTVLLRQASYSSHPPYSLSSDQILRLEQCATVSIRAVRTTPHMTACSTQTRSTATPMIQTT